MQLRRGRRFHPRVGLLALSAALPLTAHPCRGIVSSSPSAFTGTNINSFLGADAFYNAGFTGSRATVANIEGGWVWNGHESLTAVNTYFADSGSVGQFDEHATWVGAAIAGRLTPIGGEYQRGISYGATLWSGAIASNWNDPGSATYSESFNPSSTFSATYSMALLSGIGGVTADISTSSWGTQGAANGNSNITRSLDAIAYATGKTMLFAAGNVSADTSPNNTVFAPASGLNTFIVGSLGSDTTSPQYATVSTFSSRSPSDLYVPTSALGFSGSVVRGARSSVDIAAPGEDLTLAYYGGPTGGNAFGGPTSAAANQYNTGLNGTSFATPIVAGGTALVVDAGKALFPSDSKAVDGRIIKAVLMNSADKTTGWTNRQTSVNGVITTTRSLDNAVGAGRIDLARAFDQYTSGTTDLTGFSGGTVQSTGWDYGRVSEGAPADYLIGVPLTSGSKLTATLDWFADDVLSNSAYGSFDNLDLQVWSASGGVAQSLIAQSISQYNSTEHLYFDLPADGDYLVRVLWAGNNWNFVNDPHADDFGLAWSVTAVPEPAGTTAFAAAIAIAALVRRGHRRSRHTGIGVESSS